MTYKCPFDKCEKEFKTKLALVTHINWKHDKTYSIIITIIFFFFGILVSLYAEEIQYNWDKYVLGKEPDLYLSINVIYLLNNTEKIQMNDNQTYYFLNKLVDIGMIPSWHNQTQPWRSNIKDYNGCLFWAYDNANRIANQKILPENLKNSNMTYRHIMLRIPEPELIPNCEDCLALNIYGVNNGNKDISRVNFQICLSDDNYIIDASEDVIFSKNDNCFRIKRENIIENETLLGTVYIKTKKKPTYYNVWNRFFESVDGKYVSREKEFPINSRSITRLIMGIVPNCLFQ